MADSDDDEQVLDFREVSTTKMGDTSIKYSSDPRTTLGSGITSTVYPAYHFGINKPAAVKYIKKKHLRLEKDQVNELKIWSEIDQNINIVRLYDSFEDPLGGIFLAMEKAERTFSKQIEKCDPTRDDVIMWLNQVSKAVEYLHGKGVIHRDIKPDNILMFLQDGNKTVAKLADFGVSKMISGIERTGTFSNANGTLLWMAPEALENQTQKFRNTKMLDIFALGMTFYYGLSKGGHPFSFSEKSDVLTSLVAKMTGPHIISNKLSPDQLAANDLLSRMMARLPENRPKISEVLEHCLFWNWEKEQQFLIRAAICLSNKRCSETYWIKNNIDVEYTRYFNEVYPGQFFNWMIIGEQSGINITELMYNSRKRQYSMDEYGGGESVTLFLKLFRDKYVHYPELSPEAAIIFKDGEGRFCEEIYVKLLVSTCPGLLPVLYKVLSCHANKESVLPLSKIYFPWNLENKTRENDGGLLNCMDDTVERFQVNVGLESEYDNSFPELVSQFGSSNGGSKGGTRGWNSSELNYSRRPAFRHRQHSANIAHFSCSSRRERFGDSTKPKRMRETQNKFE